MKVTAEVDMTPQLLAIAFAKMMDEDQAQFFIEVAEIAKTWGPGKSTVQWSLIGGHLRDCECSTFEARMMINMIAVELT